MHSASAGALATCLKFTFSSATSTLCLPPGVDVAGTVLASYYLPDVTSCGLACFVTPACQLAALLNSGSCELRGGPLSGPIQAGQQSMSDSVQQICFKASLLQANQGQGQTLSG